MTDQRERERGFHKCIMILSGVCMLLQTKANGMFGREIPFNGVGLVGGQGAQ